MRQYSPLVAGLQVSLPRFRLLAQPRWAPVAGRENHL